MARNKTGNTMKLDNQTPIPDCHPGLFKLQTARAQELASLTRHRGTLAPSTWLVHTRRLPFQWTPKSAEAPPCPEHQPGHTEHGSTPRIASPGLEGPRKPVARTGPVHIFVLDPLLPLSLPFFVSLPSHALARSLARSLLLCTTSTASYTRCHFPGGFKKARSTPPFPTRLVVALRKTLLPSQLNRPNRLVTSPTSASAHCPSTQTFGNPNNKVTAAQHKLIAFHGKTKIISSCKLTKVNHVTPKILKDIRADHMLQEKRLFPLK